MICLNCGRTRERVVGCACIPEGFWQRPDVARARDSGDATRVIRLLRAYTDLSQEAIARLTGLSQGMVSQIESGRRSLRDPVRKRRALEGLGVSERLPEDPAAAPAAAARPATVHTTESPADVLGALPIEGAEVIRATNSRIVALDGQFGGAEIVDLVVRSARMAHRTAMAADTVGRRGFLAAAAEAQQIAGWVAYDADRQQLSRRLRAHLIWVLSSLAECRWLSVV